MEGATVTAATGALGPVVAKLAALLGHKYKLRRRTRNDIKFIRSKLKSMHTLLWMTWEREPLDAASKYLKKEVLDLADDVDDAVDDFTLGMEHSRRSRRFIQTKIIASPFQDFKKRVSDVSERCSNKWEKKTVSTLFSRKNAISSPSKPTNPRTPFVLKDASELVGMDGPRDKLIEHLVGEESTAVEPHLKMASIVGMAGMGKTALADLVYKAIGNKFQSRAFVSVTPNPNMKEVLKSILEQVAAAPFAVTKAATQDHLLDKIYNFLKDKRYLVMIDDIWHCEEWEIIRKSLPENSLGSRIVTTTQISAMSEKWRDDFDTLVYKMDPGWDANNNIWSYKIGKQDVTAGMIDVNPDMVEEGFSRYGPVVEICGGVPLAHLCMFSAVTSMVREQQEQSGLCVKKRDVLSVIQEQVEKNGIQSVPGFEPLVESLTVCYDDLPHHMLKTCLLYCSMYYRDQPFHRDTLVTQWVAEGFVSQEEEARGYFDELVNRGLIHPTDGYESLISREYGLHPTMAYFLKWKSREDNFITWISDIPSSSYTHGIHRLCIDYWPDSDDVDEESLTSIMDWSHIRSLIIFRDACYVPMKNMERLRVLSLGRSEDIEDHHLKDICGLLRLRHLFGVTGGDIRVIPPEIVRLQYLETLEMMGTSIAELPGDIGKLQRLKTLNVAVSEKLTELPLEIGDLQHLETLQIRATDLKVLPWDIIIRLKKLKALDVSRNSWMTELPREIGKLQYLESLNLCGSEGITKLPGEIGNLEHLVTLDLSATGITKLPREIENLRHLVILDLSGTEITNLPREIGKLHNLEGLFLHRTRVTKIPREVGGLKKLKVLDVDRGIGTLPWEAVQLPNLVGVPECIRQACKKSSDLVSRLAGAGEILSIHKTRRAGDRGGLIVGTNHMHIPHWIRAHFHDVDLLGIRTCKLEEKDLEILREMPNLKLLLLRLEVVPREPIAIGGEGFSRLEFLVVDSRVPRLAFQEGAMPRLFSLEVELKFYGGPPNRDPLGIMHLGSLSIVKLKWNEDWYGANRCPCIIATIDVVRKEALEHPNHIVFQVTGREDESFPQRINEASSSRTDEIEEESSRMEEGRRGGAGEIEQDIQA